MEVIMNINKKTVLVSTVLASMLTITFPSYADATKVVFNPSGVVFKKTGKFKQPKIGGMLIDACVSGSGWKKSNTLRCDSRRLAVIANDFCRSKGFKKAILMSKASHRGKHAVLTYKKGKPTNSYWKRNQGHTVIDKIFCK